MNAEDELALRAITGRVWRILRHRAVLPAALAAMLQDYLTDLDSTADARWAGIGDPARHAHLAGIIAQHIADGEWAPGDRVDGRTCGAPSPAWYFINERPETIRRAMQLLAARGDVAVRYDRYYARPHDDHP